MPQDDTLEQRYQDTGELSLAESGGAAPSSAAQAAMDKLIDRETPTPADQWVSPRRQGFVVTLPGGNKLRMKRTFDVIEMMREDGTVSNPLLGIVVQNINAGKDTPAEDLSPEQQAEMYKWICDVVCKASLEPKIVLPPDGAKFSWEAPKGQVSVADLSLEDQMFIWSVAQGGTTDLARFREESKDMLAALQSL